MNVLASECSSGCESGWTLYLEHSNFLSPNASHRNPNFVDGSNPGFCEEYYNEDKHGKEDEEEEDLSMVSDASSGPPHFHEDEASDFNDVNGHQYSASKATTLPNNSVKRQKRKDYPRREKQLPNSFLDDTASSPVIDISSKNNYALNNNQASMESVLDYSQALSATYLQGRSAFQDHFGFLQSPLSGNHLQNNQWS